MTAADCEACGLLGHPCRSHVNGPTLTKEPGCGRRDCTNPTLHSHKPLKPDTSRFDSVRRPPQCPYLECKQAEIHSHTKDNGMQMPYRPREPYFDEEPSIVPEPTSADEFRAGSWVKVWAQVTDRQTHPEDLIVRIFEHNADPLVTVARSYVENSTDRPPGAYRCTDMYHVLGEDYYVRCTSYDGKGHDHEAPQRTGLTISWLDRESSGYFEER